MGAESGASHLGETLDSLDVSKHSLFKAIEMAGSLISLERWEITSLRSPAAPVESNIVE
jgi:hypothetical protein